MQSCAQADWADVTGSVLRNHMGAVAMGTLQSQILPKRSEADKFYYFKNNNKGYTVQAQCLPTLPSLS